MYYPAKFAPAPEGGFVVTFRDIPEAITQGDTEGEARAMAADALLTAMDFYVEDNRPVPWPSAAQEGEVLIALPATAWAKVLLLNEMLSRRVGPSELARRAGVSKQTATRLTDLGHATKIDAIQSAFDSLSNPFNDLMEPSSFHVTQLRWLHDRAQRAEDADPRLKRLKEALRSAGVRVDGLTYDSPDFLPALSAQRAAITDLIDYQKSKRVNLDE